VEIFKFIYIIVILALLNKHKSKYTRRDNKYPAGQDLYSQSGICHTECKTYLTEKV
jgi:hypothetical protein